MKFMKHVLLIFLALNAINVRAHAATLRKGQNPSQAILTERHAQTGQLISNPETPQSKPKGLLNRLKQATGLSSPARERNESESQNRPKTSPSAKKSEKQRPLSFSGYGSASSPARNKIDRKSRFSMLTSKSAREGAARSAIGNMRRPSFTRSKSTPAIKDRSQPNITAVNIGAPTNVQRLSRPVPQPEASQSVQPIISRRDPRSENAPQPPHLRDAQKKELKELQKEIADQEAHQEKRAKIGKDSSQLKSQLEEANANVARRKAEETSVLNSKDTLSNLEQKMRDYQKNPQDKEAEAAYSRAKKIHAETVAAETADAFARIKAMSGTPETLPSSVQPSIMNPAHTTAATVGGAPLQRQELGPVPSSVQPSIAHAPQANVAAPVAPSIVNPTHATAPSIMQSQEERPRPQTNNERNLAFAKQEQANAAQNLAGLRNDAAYWNGQKASYKDDPGMLKRIDEHLATNEKRINQAEQRLGNANQNVAGKEAAMQSESVQPTMQRSPNPFAMSVAGVQPTRPEREQTSSSVATPMVPQGQQYQQNYNQQHPWQKQYYETNPHVQQYQQHAPLDIQFAHLQQFPAPTGGQVPQGGTPPPFFQKQQQTAADNAGVSLDEFYKLPAQRQRALMNADPNQDPNKTLPYTSTQSTPAQPAINQPTTTLSPSKERLLQDANFENMMRERYNQK